MTKREYKTLARLDITLTQKYNESSLPILMIYQHNGECSTVSLDEEEAKRFVDGNHREKMEILMKAFEELFEVI